MSQTGQASQASQANVATNSNAVQKVTEDTIRPGLYHLRFTDNGTPGGQVLAWRQKQWCFTAPSGTVPLAGWVTNDKGKRVAVAWDPIDKRDRPVEVTIHYKSAGIRGPWRFRERDKVMVEVAKLRAKGEMFSQMFGKHVGIKPTEAFFYPIAYPDSPIVYLEVEIVGRVERSPRARRGFGSDGSCEAEGEPCGFIPGDPRRACVYCGGSWDDVTSYPWEWIRTVPAEEQP